jgi:hypothetical protein
MYGSTTLVSRKGAVGNGKQGRKSAEELLKNRGLRSVFGGQDWGIAPFFTAI